MAAQHERHGAALKSAADLELSTKADFDATRPAARAIEKLELSLRQGKQEADISDLRLPDADVQLLLQLGYAVAYTGYDTGDYGGSEALAASFARA